MLETNLNRFQSVLSHKFFVAPADRNYFLARFARVYGMNEEFWWQSLQAIEKLLKAGLVLNGVSVKRNFGHNIEALWDKHLVTFGNDAVCSLQKPETLHVDFWQETSLKKFISRVNQMGNPDSRYGLVSYSNAVDDIFKLDQLIFGLRRLTIGLDWIVGEDWVDDRLNTFNGQPYRNVIQQLPNHQMREMKIPTGDFNIVGTNLEDIHYSWNLAFFRANEDIEKHPPATVAPTIAGFGNSYLFLLWESLKETPITPEVIEKINWLIDNVTVEHKVEREFKRILNG